MTLIGIDPTIDFASKRLLGSPDHPAITLHFLNAVLQFDSPITSVTILNPNIERECEDDKWSVLDIHATDEHGRLYDIEVQTTRPQGLPKRLTYYAASVLVEQLQAGGEYRELCPSIGICLLDAVQFPGLPQLRHGFLLRSAAGLLLTDCLQVHLIELPKYTPPSDNRVINEPIEQWLFFFRCADLTTREDLLRRLPDPVFAEATGVLEMIAQNPEERRFYNQRLKMERDARAKFFQALDDGRQEGREVGRQEGREVGRQEGRKEGIQQGRQEGTLIGRIQLLQELTGQEPQSTDELAARSVDELSALQLQLQQTLRGRP